MILWGKTKTASGKLVCKGRRFSVPTVAAYSNCKDGLYPNGNENPDGGNAQINIKKMNQKTFQMCTLV